MVPLGQQPWWQTDRADRWHTFGCGKSLLCWQRARFSPSCSKCELILNAFHSEGDTRNHSLVDIRGGHVGVCCEFMYRFIFVHMFGKYANASQFSNYRGRLRLILIEMFTVS